MLLLNRRVEIDIKRWGYAAALGCEDVGLWSDVGH